MYELELSKTRKDGDFLKDQNLRLTNELRSYQMQYPHHNPHSNTENALTELPPWMEKASVMSPLIQAYDIRLNELGSMCERQRIELSAFAEQVEQVVAENELLRENQLDDIKKVLQSSDDENNNKNNAGNATNQFYQSSQANLEQEERTAILMEENAVMAEQVAILQQELEKSHSHSMGCEDNVLNLTESLGDAAQAMQMLESRIKEVEAEKEQAENQLLNKVTENMSIDEGMKRCKSHITKLNTQKNEGLAMIDDLRGDKRELGDECDQLNEKVTISGTRINKISAKLAAKTLECDFLADKLRRATNELNTTRTDAEGMLSVMSGMEKQLSEFQGREEGVSQLSRECKTKVEDALLARDQSNAICASLRREVAKLLEQRKADSETAAHQNETVIDSVTTKMQGLIDGKERDVHELTIVNAKLKAANERCKREKVQAEETYAKLKFELDSQRENLKAKFGDVTKRMSEAEARCEIEESLVKQNLQLIKKLHEELDEKDTTISEIHIQVEKDKIAFQKESDGLSGRLRRITR
jgi:chromosome segregation ATPase